MNSIPVRTWREFQLAVVQLNESSSLRDVLGVILFWIRNNTRIIESEPFSIYGFNSFVEVDEGSMPVEFSSLRRGDISHIKNSILGYESNDVESIARFLRDTLEALITIEVNEKCPRCENDWMRAFIGRNNGLLAYQCDVCGYSRYSDGAKVEVGGLMFANQEQLQGFGLI